jgi:drug/metabolite transporter (DMT)-like permease
VIATKDNPVALGVIAALMASAIWGGMYVVSRVVLGVIPPVTLVMIRMFIAFVTLIVYQRVRGQDWRLPREVWGRVLAMGLVGNAFSITAQFMGTALAGAALGSLITTASPLVTVALSSALGHERVTWRAWAGLGLGLVGVLLLSGGSSGSSLAGILWLLAAAVSWGTLGLIGGRVVTRYDAATVTAWASLVGGVATACLVPWELASHVIGAITPGVVLGVLYIGVVSTAVAFAAWVYGVSRAGSVLSGIAFFAQPVVGSLLGAALLGEHLGPAFALAAVLLFIGGVVARR